MDCSKTEVFFKEWRRMCEYRTKHHTIGECPLRTKSGCGKCYYVNGIEFEMSGKLKEVQAIVQEWSDTHPIKTRLSVLYERYPEAGKNFYGYPTFCAGKIYCINCDVKYCYGYGEHVERCRKCWNTPIEDGE